MFFNLSLIIFVALFFYYFGKQKKHVLKKTPRFETQKVLTTNVVKEEDPPKNKDFVNLLHLHRQHNQQSQNIHDIFLLKNEEFLHRNPNPYTKIHLNLKRNIKLPEIKDDKQNVHDSGVRTSITKSINELEKKTMIISSLDNTLKEIRHKIFSSDMTYDDKKLATDALDKVERNTDLLTYCKNKNEAEILNIVYNRILSLKNRDEIENLLFQNLAEANNVCVSGRIARVVDTLNFIDEHVSIKPMWALRQEILGKASNIVRTYQNESEHFIKNKIREELRQNYVDNGLITLDRLNKEIDSWIDNIF